MTKDEQSIEPKEQMEALNKRGQMKFFRKVSPIGSMKKQRVKRQSLDTLCFQDRREIKNVFQLMRNQRSTLKMLDKIQIERSYVQEFSHINRLASQIRTNLCRLKQFKLCLPKSFTDKGAYFPNRMGNNHKKLQQMILIFGPSSGFSNEGLQTLAAQISKNHPQIFQLELNFRGLTKFNDQALSAVTTKIGKRLNKLRQLDLFWFTKEITDEGVKFFAEQIGNNMSHLVQLNLSFHGCIKLTQKSIEALASQFGNLKNLRQLLLSFKSCRNLTANEVLILSYHIGSYLRQLHRLSLDFSNCSKITDAGVEALAREVCSNLSQLRQLEIQLCLLPNFTDKGVFALAAQIGNNLTLTELTLEVSDCKNLTNEAATALAELIKDKLHGLQHLNLNFASCFGISNEGVKALLDSIVSLQNLQRLSLNFRSLYLSDEAFASLADLNLDPLVQLKLDFSICDEITDKTLEVLAAKLGKNPHNLQELELDFHECSSLTDEGILALVNQLDKNLQRIQKIILNVIGIKSNTDEAKEIFEDIWLNWLGQLDDVEFVWEDEYL